MGLIDLDATGPVWTITLARPEKRNALTRSMVRELAEAMAAMDAEQTARAAVLTGLGPSFCAGMDLAEFSSHGGDDWASALGPVTRRQGTTPVVAAVEGHAVAGGLELLTVADVVVAADDASLGLPEVHRGLVAAEGGLVRLSRLLPAGEVRLLALTGSPMPAERAYQLGLVNALTAPGAALATAREIAGRIAAAAPLAVAASRRIVEECGSWSAGEQWHRQDAIAREAIESADAREGAAAFVERREPQWTGA